MNGGIYAFLAGVAAVLIALLSGRLSRRKTDKLENQVKEAKAETVKVTKESELKSDITPIVSQAAQNTGRIQAEHEETVRKIESARKSNDMDAMMRIAREMAEKALSKGASER